MHLERALSDGHYYWSVAKTRREGDKVLKDRVLYLGRLDDLTPQQRALRESAVLALHDNKVLHAFYLQLARLGQPVPPATGPSTLVEEGPISLRPVDFATLTEALRQDDLTSRDLASLVSRIGLPLRPEELLAVGVRVEVGKKPCAPFPSTTGGPRPPA